MVIHIGDCYLHFTCALESKLSLLIKVSNTLTQLLHYFKNIFLIYINILITFFFIMMNVFFMFLFFGTDQ